MKVLLLLAALWGTTGAALAQTVVPPGTVPGAQPVVTPDMTNAGSPRAPKHRDKVPNMSRQDQKRLRKMSKVKATPDGEVKTPSN